MRSLRTDLIVFALIVSAAIHLGVMYYVRPLVMTHVVQGARFAKKGPMRVVRAAERPDPVRIESVADVEPTRAAPEAEKSVTGIPMPEVALPVEGAVKTEVPALALPDLPAVESAVEALPEVRTVDLSPVPAGERRMVGSADLPKPSEILAKVPKSSDAAFDVPVLNLSAPALAAAPSAGFAEPLAPSAGKRERTPPPAYVPPAEVMEKVDEKVVEAEKAAVRELVDVPDAKDLAQAVNVRVSRFYGKGETHFRVTVTPKDVLRPVPKDVVVLIDASGSIGRERMGSIRGAAKRILRSAANTGDRFNLVAFRDRYSYAFRAWQECTESSFAAADRWINNVAPFGRTDVFATISSVLTLPREPTRPLIALVVTDGEANSGVSETAEILSKFTKLNDGLVSVYMYGVKSSANRELIDVLTRGNRGESFVFQDANWFSRAHAGEGLEGLSNRFRDPVLSDLRVVFASDCLAETYPRILRNLYRGGSVEILGRVAAGTREIGFSMKGLCGSDAYEAFFRLPLDPASSDPTLPNVWTSERMIDMRLR